MTPLIVTEAVVLQKRAVGEANVVLALLSQREGLIKASAKSARKEQSKLRYGLEPFTAGRYSLVRGKYEWKIVGVEAPSRELLWAHRQARAAAGRISRLMLRLVQGEEYAPALYSDVSQGLLLLGRASQEEELENIECVLVLRILSALGYLPKNPELSLFLEHSMSIAHAHVRGVRSKLIATINESLLQTGL